MLRIEKTAQHVTICVRSHEKFWSPTLLMALGLAFGIHLCAFLIFQIQPFKLTSTFIFSPLEVQMQGSAKDGNMLAILESAPVAEEFPWLALYSPSTPKVPTSILQKGGAENLPQLVPSFVMVPLAQSSFTYQPLQISLKGQLMQRKIIPFPLLENRLIKQGTLQSHHVGYQAQIDPESGLVIWYDQIQSSGQNAIDRLAKKILLDLQFDTGQPFEALKGEIHLTFENDFRGDLYD